MTINGAIDNTSVFHSITLTDEVSLLSLLRSMKQSIEIN